MNVGDAIFDVLRQAPLCFALLALAITYIAWLQWSLHSIKQTLCKEIDSRLSAEGRLADREQRLRQIIATEPECVKIQSMDGTILEMNPAGLHLIDAETAEDIVGTSVYRVVAPEFHDIYECMTRRVFAGERVKCEFQIVSFKGRQRWLETHAAPLKDHAGNVTCLLGITRDISDLKRYEDEVRLHYKELSVSSRLSSMGQMATALAHQLNQPLAAIANYSRGCLYRLEAGARESELKWAMEHVCTQAERAGDIIASVRRFLSKGSPAFRTVDLQALLFDALRIVAPEAYARRIKIIASPSGTAMLVSVDPIQMEQVILNIVRNAIEAMESEHASEKVLTITTEIASSDMAQLSFQDTGPVVIAVDLEKIFEPFFTTKSMGMGMGLPISRSIIEAHRGHLEVRTNAPYPGMTFVVQLPIAEDAS